MRFAYPALLFCAAACASAPSGSRSVVSNAETQPGLLSAPAAASPTRGQILTGSLSTEYYAGESLHDVLRRRLPLYLRPRSIMDADITGRADPIAVYIDGAFSGSLDVLTLIPASQVFSVQRMSAGEAMIRFGPKHKSGALVVVLKRP